MPQISIIIPIYNAEQCLHNCLVSILSQSFVDFEVICINDGSTDKSGIICDEYAAKDNRIKVVHKNNGGVSSARNVGIFKAQGEWLTFVDADDVIGENYILNLLPNDDEDFVMDSSDVRSPSLIDGIYDGKNMIEKAFTGWQMLCPWGKLFKKSIIEINKILFDESGCLGEDTIFNLTYLLYITKLRISSKSEYKYNSTSVGSLSKSPEIIEKAIYKACIVYKLGKQFAKKYEDSTLEEKISKFAGITWTLWYSLLPYTISERSMYIKRMLKSSDIKSLMDNYLKCNESGRKYLLFYWLCKLKLYSLAAIIIP